MKFVKEKESKKEGFLERLFHKIDEAKVIRGGHILATFTLSGNPKLGRGWVAKVNPETGNIEFLKATEWYNWGGSYLIEPGDLILEKMDDNSWRHRRSIYTLYKFTKEGKPIEIASISFLDRSPSFSNDTLEEIYVTTPPVEGKNRAVQALLTYYKTQVPEEVEKLEVKETGKPQLEEAK